MLGAACVAAARLVRLDRGAGRSVAGRFHRRPSPTDHAVAAGPRRQII